MNHKLQGFALKTGGFLQLIFATPFVLDRYIIALRVVNGRLFKGLPSLHGTLEMWPSEKETLHALMCFLVNLSNKSDALRMNNSHQLLHEKADQYDQLESLIKSQINSFIAK